MHPQIPLPFLARNQFTFDGFIAAGNDLLLASLRQASEPYIFISGSTGTGKTHLLQASCQEASALGKTASYLPLREMPHAPAEILQGLGQIDLVCIDDIECVCSDEVWEEALFNLFNQLKQNDSQLIISSKSLPSQLAIKLKDLQSRLNSGLAIAISPLDDEATITAIIQRAEQQGFVLSPEVARYVLTHHPRDLPSLWSLLDQVNHATLSAQKKLTIPFLKKMLDELKPL